MSDMGSVQTYAPQGLRLWAAGEHPHGEECPCLICGDTRAHERATQEAESEQPTPQEEEAAA